MDLGAPQHVRVNAQFTLTGSPTTVSASIEGSLDGVNWEAFADYSNAPGKSYMGNEAETLICTKLRMNLKTLTGGTSPTVSALMATVDPRTFT